MNIVCLLSWPVLGWRSQFPKPANFFLNAGKYLRQILFMPLQIIIKILNYGYKGIMFFSLNVKCKV